jgi:hypothetical protein
VPEMKSTMTQSDLDAEAENDTEQDDDTTAPSGPGLDRTKHQAEAPRPSRRPLKIYAFDPMLGRSARTRIVLDIPNEPVGLGPVGSRLEVIDYDATNQVRYPPVDLQSPEVLMGSGLDPTESDPKFHQQMVYAVASRVIENFEKALGRRWAFRGGRRLRLYPHAFQLRNAFYEPTLVAVLFGYFPADLTDPGANIPGQAIFTCLSHDIVAHEVTHGMVDRMRRHYLEPSNPDVLAFHEGFADIVAILQHFSFASFLEDTIQQTRTDLRSPTPLVTLAQQFGYATGKGQALRSAGGTEAPDRQLYETEFEPHERGAILVAAVFDAFFSTYQVRIADLVRISTGGTGRLGEGDLHPDLVKRIAKEASATAQNVLTMCIRAFDYLPPVDITYSDYLRALVTADSEVVPDDPLEQRNALIEAFRNRGIRLEDVASLSLEALRWPARVVSEPLPEQEVQRELDAGARTFRIGVEDFLPRKFDQGTFRTWARAHAGELDLDPDRPIQVDGLHSLWRVTKEGGLRVDLVIQFVQTCPPEEFEDLAGIPLRGGTTVVADADGFVRYVISKPLPQLAVKRAQAAAAADGSPVDPAVLADPRHIAGERRLERLRNHIAATDERDARAMYDNEVYYEHRLERRSSIRALHAGLR